MKIWLVLPVKPFGKGKSRLAAVLDEDTRTVLNRTLMTHVLETALASQLLTGIVVVSHDPTALAIARSYAVHGLEEQGHGLNGALTQGRTFAMQNQADALLVLPSDLPLLTVGDFQLLLSHVEDTSAITIAPSPDGGTNALLLHPPDAIPFHFGRNSFAHHSASAGEAGFAIRSVTSQGLQTDIDMPQDLLQLPPRLLAQLSHSASSAQPWR